MSPGLTKEQIKRREQAAREEAKAYQMKLQDDEVILFRGPQQRQTSGLRVVLSADHLNAARIAPRQRHHM
jgi:hypothetical protein